MENELMNALIIHDNDPDGIAAAITVGHSLSLKVDCPEHIEYVKAVRYQEPDWEKIDKDTEIYIVDFNYNAEITKKLCEVASQVVVIDHHKTAREELTGLYEIKNLSLFILLDHAACVAAWIYFNGDESDPPSILHFIEDMDLWRWKLPNSALVSAFLDSVKPDINTYWPFITGKTALGDVLDAGQAVLNYKNKTIEILTKQAVLMEIGGHKVHAVNCADPSLVSYLGNVLAKDQPFGATFYLQPNGLWKFSIRSIIGEDLPGVDVSEVAKIYGGGGHNQASGFKVDTLFPFKIIKDAVVSR